MQKERGKPTTVARSESKAFDKIRSQAKAKATASVKDLHHKLHKLETAYALKNAELRAEQKILKSTDQRAIMHSKMAKKLFNDEVKKFVVERVRLLCSASATRLNSVTLIFYRLKSTGGRITMRIWRGNTPESRRSIEC